MGTKIQNVFKDVLNKIGASSDLIKCFDVNNKMYHYTNLTALIGIIKSTGNSNGMWLSNAEFLNDNDEIQHGKKIVEEYVKEIVYNYSINKEIESKVSENLNKNDYCFYVGCFSKSCNLDQWRHYSNDGEGICIEFDLTDKDNYFEQLMMNNPNNPPFIFPVIYDDNLKKEFVKTIYQIILLARKNDDKFINKTLELPTGKLVGAYGLYSALTMSMPILGAVVGLGGFIYDKIKENNEKEKEKEKEKVKAINNGIKELGKSLEIDNSLTELEAFSKVISLYLPILKNNDFKSEDEIRVVYYDKNKSTINSKLKYRESNGSKIIPYISSDQLLDPTHQIKFPITQILIGPKNKNNFTLQKSIKFFLENNGYHNVKVEFSDSPYQK